MGCDLGYSRDITLLLNSACRGNADAVHELFPIVYDAMRALAYRHMQAERPDHTLQPTALAHEAYLKLVGQREVDWKSRAQFFALSAQAMRRILVDYARRHGAEKRGGDRERVPMDVVDERDLTRRSTYVLSVDEALRRLAQLDPRASTVVELRFFGGLSIEETAEVLGVAPRTVKRDWRMARAWLARAFDDGS